MLEQLERVVAIGRVGVGSAYNYLEVLKESRKPWSDDRETQDIEDTLNALPILLCLARAALRRQQAHEAYETWHSTEPRPPLAELTAIQLEVVAAERELSEAVKGLG